MAGGRLLLSWLCLSLCLWIEAIVHVIACTKRPAVAGEDGYAGVVIGVELGPRIAKLRAELRA
jgi:hypothetical protein